MPAHERLRTIGCDHQARLQLGHSLLGTYEQLHSIGVRLDMLETRRAQQLHVGTGLQLTPQYSADTSVGRNIAERCDALLASVDAREPEAALVGNVDAPDGGSIALEPFPDSHAAENPPAAVGKRRGAVVEARLHFGLQRYGLDQGHAQAKRAQRRGEARPHHAAAHDRDVE